VIGQRAASHPGLLQIEFVYPTHQLQIAAPQAGSRATVVAGTGHTKKLATAFNRNFRMPGGNHLLFLRPAKFSPGRLDKKSFSALSLPITTSSASAICSTR
jgi:hypothetical protein